MVKSFPWIGLLCILLLLAGCASPITQPAAPSTTAAATTANATATPVSQAQPAVTNPAATAVSQNIPPAIETDQAVTSEPIFRLTTTPAPGETQDGAQAAYLDDRSTPTGLIQSLFNAINRKEYLRAYSYWENAGNSSNVPPFSQFEQGYQDTATVDVTIGVVGGDVGAGQIYYTVPVVLQVHTTAGKGQTFAGCYTLHLPKPDFQAAPPFQPLAIQMGLVKAASNSPNTDDLLSHACDGPDVRQTNPIHPSPVTNTTDLTASNYLDNRSDPLLVLSSLFNAINRKEYVRAYSYWETPGASQTVPPFSQFQQGYQETASVEADFGAPVSGAAAGNIYYTVPTALKVLTTTGQTQTFVGCYTLHLAQPTIQASPPFQPLGIKSAIVKQVSNIANVTSLLSTACQNVP